MEALEELLAHVTVLFEAKYRHYHWLYGDGTSYCGRHKPPYWSHLRLRKISEITPYGRHVCKKCRHVARLIKEGKNPGLQHI